MRGVLETSVEAPMENLDAFAVTAQGVSVRRGRTQAIRDLSLHIPRGAIYGLVGPSGAGKTTAIRVLATVQRPDRGSVAVDGIDALAHPLAARARIGYLPDAAGVYEALTARESLTFYATLFRLPAQQRRQSVDDLLELFRLTPQANRPVGDLSRGMRQQLAIARCLIHDPSVLLLDEPASGMDPPARQELRDILTELARLGKSVLISSHLLSELADVCTHLGFMRSGELIAEGEIDDLALGQDSLEDIFRVLMAEPEEGHGGKNNDGREEDRVL